MLNCDLKIITKTFANRKNKFLEEIIHESQTAYMLQINWSRFGLEDCCIKLHPENLFFFFFLKIIPEYKTIHWRNCKEVGQQMRLAMIIVVCFHLFPCNSEEMKRTLRANVLFTKRFPWSKNNQFHRIGKDCDRPWQVI